MAAAAMTTGSQPRGRRPPAGARGRGPAAGGGADPPAGSGAAGVLSRCGVGA